MTNSPYYKFRVGMYRVIVDVINDKLILHMVKVKKRARVYD
ncbi:type II toxin-antitoxin system RelE family toxin [Nitrosopumilus sp.]